MFNIDWHHGQVILNKKKKEFIQGLSLVCSEVKTSPESCYLGFPTSNI